MSPCSWGCSYLARIIRRLVVPVLVLLLKVLVTLRVEGHEHLELETGPVIFAANHESELDTLFIFAALPARWRYRTAVSMCDWTFAGRWYWIRMWKRMRYYSRVLALNGFTLPREIGGLWRSYKHMAALSSAGWSILIYPEGDHSFGFQPFRGGVGMMAARLRLPVVPVLLEGTHRILPKGGKLMRPGSIRVRFGKSLHPEGRNYQVLARRVEQAVRELA